MVRYPIFRGVAGLQEQNVGGMNSPMCACGKRICGTDACACDSMMLPTYDGDADEDYRLFDALIQPTCLPLP